MLEAYDSLSCAQHKFQRVHFFCDSKVLVVGWIGLGSFCRCKYATDSRMAWSLAVVWCFSLQAVDTFSGIRGSMSNYYDDYDDIDEMEDDYDMDDPIDDMVDEHQGIRDSDAEDNDYGQPVRFLFFFHILHVLLSLHIAFEMHNSYWTSIISSTATIQACTILNADLAYLLHMLHCYLQW